MNTKKVQTVQYECIARTHASRDETSEGMRGWLTPNLENLPFHRAKTVVQCISVVQLTGPRTIGELQTGKYVVRAEDLPRANKLSCAQRPIKRVELEKYA